MSQKATVLRMLRDAGPEGVSSKTFIAQYMPRAAARIQELKDSGENIVTERDGKYVIYKLVGQGAGTPQGAPSSVLSGQSPGTTDQPATSLAAESSASVPGEARLFDLAPRSAFTDDELAA